MKTIKIYEKGDTVKIVKNWRKWKVGDIATVMDCVVESGIYPVQYLILSSENKEAEKDANCLHSYNCELV